MRELRARNRDKAPDFEHHHPHHHHHHHHNHHHHHHHHLHNQRQHHLIDDDDERQRDHETTMSDRNGIVVIVDAETMSNGNNFITDPESTNCSSSTILSSSSTSTSTSTDSGIDAVSGSQVYYTADHEVYQRGDWIYVEYDESKPYQLRKIYEFTKSPDGCLKAKLSCIYRRADISPTLLSVFEREYHSYYECLNKQLAQLFSWPTTTKTNEQPMGNKSPQSAATTLNFAQFLRQKEVFFSEDIETNVPVECFRGKASVKLFMPDVDTVADFLGTSVVPSAAKLARKTRKTTSPCKLEAVRASSKRAQYSDCISDEDKYFYLGKYNSCDKSVECAHVEISDECHQWEKEMEIPECRGRTRENESRHRTTTGKKHLVQQKPEFREQRKMSSSKRGSSPLRESALKVGKENSCKNKQRYFSEIRVVRKRWSSGDEERFREGFFKLFKDFSQIQKEFLPHKSVQDLIEYYQVVWKTSNIKEHRARSSTTTTPSGKFEEIFECSVARHPLLMAASWSIADPTTADMTTSNMTGARLCTSCDENKPACMFRRIGAQPSVVAAAFNSWFNTTTASTTTTTTTKRPTTQSSCKSQPSPSTPTTDDNSPVNSTTRELKKLKRRSLLVDCSRSTTSTSERSTGSHNESATTLSSPNLTQSQQPIMTSFDSQPTPPSQTVASAIDNMVIKHHPKITLTTPASHTQQQQLLQPTLSSSSSSSRSNSIKCEKICLSCQIYWKKHAVFKNGCDPNLNTAPVIPRQDPNKRLERIEALKNQVLTCDELGCGLHFGKLQLFKRHLRYAHALPSKKRSLEFYLQTNAITKKTRRMYFKQQSHLASLRRLVLRSWAEPDLVGYGKLAEFFEYFLFQASCQLRFSTRRRKLRRPKQYADIQIKRDRNNINLHRIVEKLWSLKSPTELSPRRTLSGGSSNSPSKELLKETSEITSKKNSRLVTECCLLSPSTRSRSSSCKSPSRARQHTNENGSTSADESFLSSSSLSSNHPRMRSSNLEQFHENGLERKACPPIISKMIGIKSVYKSASSTSSSRDEKTPLFRSKRIRSSSSSSEVTADMSNRGAQDHLAGRVFFKTKRF